MTYSTHLLSCISPEHTRQGLPGIHRPHRDMLCWSSSIACWSQKAHVACNQSGITLSKKGGVKEEASMHTAHSGGAASIEDNWDAVTDDARPIERRVHESIKRIFR